MLISTRYFCIWIIWRAAVRQRRTETGDPVFRGNFQQIQLAKPVQDALETDELFREPLCDWRSHLPRGNTFPQVLALAHEKLVRDGYSDWKAAYLLLQEILPACPLHGAEWSRWSQKHRIPWMNAKLTVGGSRRARRTKKKRKGYSRADRLVERLRTAVARYKRKHPHFDQQFEIWQGIFRWQFVRDKARYTRTELSYRACLMQREATLGPGNYMVAEAAIILARHYHEQSKFSEGEALYRRAWSVLLSETTLPPRFRQLMLNQCAIGIGTCANTLPMCSVPAYAGPRMVTALLG